jgi:hypothetical protein
MLMHRIWIALLLCLFMSDWAVLAAERVQKFDARLIWGTDQDKPDHADLKEIDPGLRKKLCKVFKWKNYFEVSRKDILLPQQSFKKIRMSPKCELEFAQVGPDGIEVKLYGENKLVFTKKQTLLPGEPMVLAGDDKNDTAWFVIITEQKQ